MIKVLYFVDRLRRGGIQSLLYDILTLLNRREVVMDVLTLDDGNHYELEDDIKALGVRVYKLHGIWINSLFDIVPYMRAADCFFKKHHDYDAIHLNSSSKNALILYYAKKYNIKTRIAHAHNTGFQTNNILKVAFGNSLKAFLNNVSTHKLACSTEAGRWLFGKETFCVMPNGVIVDRYRYNEQWRKEIRKSLNISDGCLLIGCIGRFVKQKNHKFLLPVMERIKGKGDFKLLLIGSGELQNDLQEGFNRIGLSEDVIFTGFRNDCNKWYSAMDLLVMPSLYEGFPVAMVEAQATGLPIIASDTITKEARLSPLVRFLPIGNAYQEWADAIMSASKNENRGNCDYISDTEYDMRNVVNRLVEIYASGR